jgi:hypothetical protein
VNFDETNNIKTNIIKQLELNTKPTGNTYSFPDYIINNDYSILMHKWGCFLYQKKITAVGEKCRGTIREKKKSPGMDKIPTLSVISRSKGDI